MKNKNVIKNVINILLYIALGTLLIATFYVVYININPNSFLKLTMAIDFVLIILLSISIKKSNSFKIIISICIVLYFIMLIFIPVDYTYKKDPNPLIKTYIIDRSMNIYEFIKSDLEWSI